MASTARRPALFVVLGTGLAGVVLVGGARWAARPVPPPHPVDVAVTAPTTTTSTTAEPEITIVTPPTTLPPQTETSPTSTPPGSTPAQALPPGWPTMLPPPHWLPTDPARRCKPRPDGTCP